MWALTPASYWLWTVLSLLWTAKKWVTCLGSLQSSVPERANSSEPVPERAKSSVEADLAAKCPIMTAQRIAGCWFLIMGEGCSLCPGASSLGREVHSVIELLSFVSCCPSPMGGERISILSFGNWLWGFCSRAAATFPSLWDLHFLPCLAAAVHHVRSLSSPLFLYYNASISYVLPRGSFGGHRHTWVYLFFNSIFRTL